MKTILLFGGNSDERLVSVASAQNLAQKYTFTEIWYMTREGAFAKVTGKELAAHKKPFENEFVPAQEPFAADRAAALPSLQGHVVFLAFHGTEGEDGQLQGWLEKNRIPFTGSGASSSQNCFDKLKAKKFLREVGATLAPETRLSMSEKSTWVPRMRQFFSKHGAMVVKPVANGSSVGLQIVRTPEALEKALNEVPKASFGDYLVESFVEGRELTVGVLQKKSGEVIALPPSETVIEEGFDFDYQGKYLGRGSTEITPAKLTKEQKKAAQDLALLAHKVLGCAGYTRTDMMLTEAGPIFLETNTLPGLTKASFIPQQLKAADIQIADFIEEQLQIAKDRF